MLELRLGRDLKRTPEHPAIRKEARKYLEGDVWGWQTTTI